MTDQVARVTYGLWQYLRTVSLPAGLRATPKLQEEVNEFLRDNIDLALGEPEFLVFILDDYSLARTGCVCVCFRCVAVGKSHKDTVRPHTDYHVPYARRQGFVTVSNLDEYVVVGEEHEV